MKPRRTGRPLPSSPFRRLRLSGLVAIGLVVAVMVAVAAESREEFDGEWRVAATTAEGRCWKSLNFSIRVDDGALAYRGVFGSAEAGDVIASDGELKLEIARLGATLRASGKLDGTEGKGEWDLAKLSCKGGWTARRA